MTGSRARTIGLVTIILAAVGATALAGRAGDGGPGTVARGPEDPVRGVTLVASLSPSEALGTLVTGFGDVWLDDRAAEKLVRLDARTGRVLARFPLDGRTTLAAGRGSMWALQRGEGSRSTVPRPLRHALTGPLLRIDPRTNRVRARVAIRSPAGRQVLGFGVLAGPGGVWIWGPADLLRVDVRRGRVDRAIGITPVDGEVTGAVLHRGDIVLATAGGRLLRHDARSGAPLGSAHTGLQLSGMDAGGDSVLLSARGVLAAADPVTGRVAWRRRLGYRIGGAVLSGGRVWAQASPHRSPRDVLVGLDPRTGRVLARAALNELGTFSLDALRGQLWMSTAGGRVVVMRP